MAAYSLLWRFGVWSSLWAWLHRGTVYRLPQIGLVGNEVIATLWLRQHIAEEAYQELANYREEP